MLKSWEGWDIPNAFFEITGKFVTSQWFHYILNLPGLLDWQVWSKFMRYASCSAQNQEIWSQFINVLLCLSFKSRDIVARLTSMGSWWSDSVSDGELLAAELKRGALMCHTIIYHPSGATQVWESDRRSFILVMSCPRHTRQASTKGQALPVAQALLRKFTGAS